RVGAAGAPTPSSVAAHGWAAGAAAALSAASALIVLGAPESVTAPGPADTIGDERTPGRATGIAIAGSDRGSGGGAMNAAWGTAIGSDARTVVAAGELATGPGGIGSRSVTGSSAGPNDLAGDAA